MGVSLPRLPSTRSLARRVTLGTLLSSSWVLLLRPPMFPRLQMSLVRSTRSQAVVFVVHKTSATLGPRQTSFMIHLLKLLERPLALRSETKLIRHSIHLWTAAVSTAPASTAPLPMVTATPMERSPMVTPLSARTTQSFPEASNWLVCVGSGLAVLYFMRIDALMIPLPRIPVVKSSGDREDISLRLCDAIAFHDYPVVISLLWGTPFLQ